jgi:SAM-dependent methyltransferase
MMAEKTILDVCCGSRMFWFDRNDERVIFCDKRAEQHMLKDKTVPGGQRELIISPNIQADFTALPFPSNHFQMVVFDPPHFDTSGPKSWIRAKYGALEGNWRAMLASGFDECFRVLVTNGVLVFKWSSVQIPLSEILKLTSVSPLFGHQSGKRSLTHWVAFTKPNTASTGQWGFSPFAGFIQAESLAVKAGDTTPAHCR